MEVEEVKEVKEVEEVETNIYFPSHYSPSGCPTVPLAFSGMTGRQLSPTPPPPSSPQTLPPPPSPLTSPPPPPRDSDATG